ncbi:MAG: LLM class flavin-dependent oxidoreductase [Acidimicrobiia bacterium]|nr:LLM class flavin-dependent oxidoreductase [Acidimicrobiia bacterium]
MRIGTSLNSLYLEDDVRAGARMMLERAAAAADAELDGLYVGDHHVTGAPYFQNSPILGRILADWPRGRVGALYLLPLWHPVLVAEQVGTLAALAPEGFVLQCAVGGGPGQFAGMGVDMRRRARDFEASLDVVRRLLAGERVTTEEPYPIQDAATGPTPPEPVEVWIGADAEKAIGRAARLGDAWYAGPNLTFAEAESKLAHHRDRCAAEGARPSCVPIRRDVYVADSPDDAARIRRPILEHGSYRGFDPLGAGDPERPSEVAGRARRASPGSATTRSSSATMSGRRPGGRRGVHPSPGRGPPRPRRARVAD